MKQSVFFLLFLLLTLLTACTSHNAAADPTSPSTVPVTEVLTVTEDLPVTVSTEPETTPASPEPVLELTEKEKNMLLKLGMAERGENGCTTCIALVMRTVLNRLEAGQFGDSIRSVIFAPEQFTPVTNGSYHSAKPNDLCYEALEMVICGWDDSQGALFYEWCEGESWHSQNLQLLFQHCDVRFYH